MALQISARFPSEIASVPLARRFVRNALGSPPPSTLEVINDVELAVSELATNGIRHGSGEPVTVDLDRDDRSVNMRVTSMLAPGADDNSSGWETARTTAGGHGIGIVRALSTSFNIRFAGRTVSASCSFRS